MKKTTKTTKYQYQPKEWQRDPKNINGTRVQYWANGIMVTAQMSIDTAREMIINGSAFVMTEQAIGQMVNGYANS